MGKDPSDIRAEIEQTRARVGEEVEALSWKTDVGARTHDLIEEKKSAVRETISGIAGKITGGGSGGSQGQGHGGESRSSGSRPIQAVGTSVAGFAGSAAGTVKSKLPDRQQLGRAKSAVEANPVALLAGGFALGLVAGLAIPASRIEEQRIGPLGERVLDAAKETAGEAVERGKQVAQEAARAATDTAKDSGKEQGEELVSTLRERAGTGAGTGAGSSEPGSMGE